MLIIILEFTSNIIIHIHSKYTFGNPDIFKYIFLNTQNRPLYIHRLATKLVTFATNGTYVVFFGWNQTSCKLVQCNHKDDQHKK
jgi:hypothetical protein